MFASSEAVEAKRSPLDEPLETGAVSPRGEDGSSRPTLIVRVFQMFLIWRGGGGKKNLRKLRIHSLS